MDVWLLALGLMLVLEGLLPTVAPSRWRHLFTQMLQLHDGQIRFFGVFMVLAGLALVWWIG
ncbi:DUF2065 domain-containing protein [Limnohabitans sp.]|uniref:DUF2065 domain-containing protein n=1 Tax=Limnohabitans sp. TaxID=1907725 RepID=UPI0035B32371